MSMWKKLLTDLEIFIKRFILEITKISLIIMNNKHRGMLKVCFCRNRETALLASSISSAP